MPRWSRYRAERYTRPYLRLHHRQLARPHLRFVVTVLLLDLKQKVRVHACVHECLHALSGQQVYTHTDAPPSTRMSIHVHISYNDQ